MNFSGGGLEQGEPSFQAFTDAKKFLLKDGRTKAASLLWRAVAGGAAIGERLQHNTRCRACGARETSWHRYYGCPALAAPADDEFSKTWLEKARSPAFPAMERHVSSSVLWPYQLGASGYLEPEVVDQQTNDAMRQLHLGNTLYGVASDYARL